jgi:pentatricopeptide repeat protein
MLIWNTIINCCGRAGGMQGVWNLIAQFNYFILEQVWLPSWKNVEHAYLVLLKNEARVARKMIFTQ